MGQMQTMFWIVILLFAIHIHISFQQYQYCNPKADHEFNVTLNAINGTESCAGGLISGKNTFFGTVPNDTNARFITCTVELDVDHGLEAVQVALMPNKSSTWLGGGFSDSRYWSIAYRRVPVHLRYRGARARFVVVAAVESTPMLFSCAVQFVDYRFAYFGNSFSFRVWLNTSTVADIPAENRAPISAPPLLQLDDYAYAIAIGNESTAFEVDTQAGDELVVQYAAMRAVSATLRLTEFSLPVPTNWSDYNGIDPTLATFRYYSVSVARATTPVLAVGGRATLTLSPSAEFANWTTSNTVNLITVLFQVNKPCAVAPQVLAVGSFADGSICQLATTNQFALNVTRRAALDIQIARSQYGYSAGYNVSIANSNGSVVFADQSTIWTVGSGATSTSSVGTFLPGLYNITLSRIVSQPPAKGFAIGFLENDCRLAADPDASCATNDTCSILGRCNMTSGACVNHVNGTWSSPCTPPTRYLTLLSACQAINATLAPLFLCNTINRCSPRGSCYPSCNTGICCGNRCMCLPGTTGPECLDPVDPPAILSQGTQLTVNFSAHSQQLVGVGTETVRLFNWGNSGRVLKFTFTSTFDSSLINLAGSGNATRLVIQRRGGHKITVDDGWPFVVSACRFSSPLIEPVWMHHAGNIGWVVRNDNLNRSDWVETQASIKSPWANSVVVYPRFNSDQDVNVTDPRYSFGFLSLTLTLKNTQTLAPSAVSTTTSTMTASTTRTTTTTNTMQTQTQTVQPTSSTVTRTTTTSTTTARTTTTTTAAPTTTTVLSSTTTTSSPSSVSSSASTSSATSSSTTASSISSSSVFETATTLLQPAQMSPSSPSAGLIVAIVVGVILALLIGFGAFSWWRRNRSAGYTRSDGGINADGIAGDSDDDNKL